MSGIRIRLLAVIGIVSGAWSALSLPARRRNENLAISDGKLPKAAPVPAPAVPTAQKHARTTAATVAPPARAKSFVSAPKSPDVQAGQDRPSRMIDGVRTRHNTDMSKIRGAFGYGKELFQRFGSDQCGSWAASLSFFAVLSIAPILLCGLAILGFLFQSTDEALKSVHKIVASFVPDRAAANALIDQLKIKDAAATLIKAAPRTAVIGILSLVWSSLQIFVNAVAPINAAFRAAETRNWLKLRMSALGLLLATGVLFLFSLAPTSGVALFGRLNLGHLPQPVPPILAVVFFATGMLLNGLTVTVIYMYLPSPVAKLSWRAALSAGGIVALLSEVAKQAFSVYLMKFANYNKVYGSLGGLIAIVFWIYYSSMILLLGAEMAKLYQDNLDYARDQAEDRDIETSA